jgi:exonuclease VII small subunit
MATSGSSPTLSADQRLALVLRAVQRIERAQGDLEDAVESLQETVVTLTTAVEGMQRTLQSTLGSDRE